MRRIFFGAEFLHPYLYYAGHCKVREEDVDQRKSGKEIWSKNNIVNGTFSSDWRKMEVAAYGRVTERKMSVASEAGMLKITNLLT